MPTASSTLATIMESVVDTSVDLATTVITTYWPYVLVIGIIAGLIGVFSRLTHLGTGKGK
jgi:H+/Cl- antiporter ClcA